MGGWEGNEDDKKLILANSLEIFSSLIFGFFVTLCLFILSAPADFYVKLYNGVFFLSSMRGGKFR